MIRLRSNSKKLFKRRPKMSWGDGGDYKAYSTSSGDNIKWELRPGGLFVQKRENGASVGEEVITVRVSTVSHRHDMSFGPTSTFGELKMILSNLSSLEPRAQRLLFRGKEREDGDFLHMFGVKDMDKVLMLEDPAVKERKLHAYARKQAIGNPCHTITV